MNSEQSSITPTGQLPEAESQVNSEDSGSSLLDQSLENLVEEQKLEDRRIRVFKAHVIDGMSYQQIADDLQISRYTVQSDLKAYYKVRRKLLEKGVKRLQAKQDAIYEHLLNKWLPIACGTSTPISVEADLEATDRVLKILSDQAKLHGVTNFKKDKTPTLGKAIGQGVVETMMKLASQRKPNVIQGEVIDNKLTDAKETDNSESAQDTKS
jgi:predicted DNA-binding protein YlxM (UPF0122 family)